MLRIINDVAVVYPIQSGNRKRSFILGTGPNKKIKNCYSEHTREEEKIVKMANEFGPEGEQRDVFGSGDASEKIMKIIVDLGERFYK